MEKKTQNRLVTMKVRVNTVVEFSGANILQKEEDFVLGILGVLLGKISGF